MPFSTEDLVPQSPTPIMEHDSDLAFRTPKSRPATESSTNTSIEELLSMEESDAPQQAHDSEDDDGVTASSSSPVVSPASTTSPPYWLNHNQQTYSTLGEGSTESGGITMMDNEVDDEDGNNPRGSACWARAVEIPDYVVVNGSATNIGAFVVFNVRVQTMNVSAWLLSAFPGLRPAYSSAMFGSQRRQDGGSSFKHSLSSICKTDTLVISSYQGSYMNIRKRYSEFDDFRKRLVQTFPNFEAAVPALPPKSLISKLRPKFLDKRKAGLQYFLKWVSSLRLFFSLNSPLSLVPEGFKLMGSNSCILLNPEFSGSPVLKEFLFA
jgi:hypothetical protein